MTGYATNQYCSVKCSLASMKRVAASVDHAIAPMANINPTIPFMDKMMPINARNTTGSKQ